MKEKTNPTKDQKEFLGKCDQRNAISFVARSLREVKIKLLEVNHACKSRAGKSLYVEKECSDIEDFY